MNKPRTWQEQRDQQQSERDERIAYELVRDRIMELREQRDGDSGGEPMWDRAYQQCFYEGYRAASNKSEFIETFAQADVKTDELDAEAEVGE